MSTKPKRITEAVGLWTGGLMAPVFAVGSWLRQNRVFHPRGVYFRATTTAAENVDEELSEVATQLAANDALVRFSTGRGRERTLLPDINCVSIRFGTERGEVEPRQDAQDILMMTARRVITLPIAAIATDQQNFAGNIYHGGAPFEVGNQQNMILRLVPMSHVETSGTDRYQNLRNAVEEGAVTFRLEAAKQAQPNKWYPMVEIQLANEVLVDDLEVEFSPFRVGRRVIPQGFVQYTRLVPYLMSQYARDV